MKSRFRGWLVGSFAAVALAGGGASLFAQSPVNFGRTKLQAEPREAPGMPAAPLAGGVAAATGGQFMDAYGNSIVMPASYCQPTECYGGPEGCSCDPNGMGFDGGPDEAQYADFGGYSQPDQCGPHYFDIGVETVWLQGEGLFKGAPALGSIGPGLNAPRIANPTQTFNDYEPGFQIAARLDFGPLSVLEATYMGIYDIGFNESVTSNDFNIFSFYSDYGTGTLIEGLDAARLYNYNYNASLQSTELSYRRYWLGFNPRISGTYLLGARYIRLAEDLNFTAIATGDATSDFAWRASNDMVGFQFGGDAWIQLRQGLRIGGEAKSGIYNNRYEFGRNVNTPDVQTPTARDGNQVAFAAEARLDMVADILPSWSIRGGYRAFYMNSLTTVGTNVPQSLDSTLVNTQSDVLFHGFQGGIEYTW